MAEDSRRGLVLGKFMPPHLGHLHLVEVARSQVERLTILVCSLRREPIDGCLRYEWMRELAPTARVIHVSDENPSEPKDDPLFWEIWIDTIRRHVPDGVDVVFTSESYGDQLAARLGARHVKVDEPRRIHPVSATMIRRNPLAHWQYIPPAVRPYFVKRVCLTGSESTGKTTLAADLAAHFRTTWNPEYARDYLDAKPTPLDAADIEPIARGQIASEEQAAREANRVLILDTDLTSTVVYAKHYYGFCPEWIERAAADRRADVYLLMDTDTLWVADPQRDRPRMRDHMQNLFRRELKIKNSSYVNICGMWSDRRERAVTVIDALLAEVPTGTL